MTTIHEGRSNLAPLFILVALLVVTTGIAAQESGHGRAIADIVSEIIRTEGVSSLSDVDPDSVAPSLLEELGDSVMARMIDDEQKHEWMDEMMGGEGSSELAAMHRWIGYGYVESDGDIVDSGWGPGMMGFATMGRGMMGPWGWNDGRRGWGHGSMMGFWSPWGWIVGILVVGAIVLLIVILVRRRGGRAGSAMETLKQRYANGDISREEFQRMRDELR